MHGFPARTKINEKGVINPLIIGAVIVGILVVVGIASGALKFSGSIKNNNSNQQSSQPNSSSVTDNSKAELAQEKNNTAVKLNSEAFVSTKYGYSISFPEGWKAKEQENTAMMFKSSETKGPDQADALVSVVAGDLGENRDIKLTTIGDIHKAYIKKQFADVEFIGEKGIKVNGQDAYEIEFTGSVNTEKMRAKYIVIKGTNYLFAIIGMANGGLWDSEKSNIDASIQTFKLQ